MTKAEYIKRNGLTIREATEQDRQAAATDYQREAGFIITNEAGREYYSKRGSLADCRQVVRWSFLHKIAAALCGE